VSTAFQANPGNLVACRSILLQSEVPVSVVVLAWQHVFSVVDNSTGVFLLLGI